MTNSTTTTSPGGLKQTMGAVFGPVPLLGILLGFLACVLIEQAFGETLANWLKLPKIPVLFGILTVSKVIAHMINSFFKTTELDPAILIHAPSALIYVSLVYLVPLAVVGRLTAGVANRVAGAIKNLPLLIPALLHLGLMYIVLHVWAGASDYRLITLKLTLIAVLLTLSLNIINGYMGEFSCSHPGFMAIGAYMSSLFTVGLFVNDRVLGDALLPFSLAYLTFPVALLIGGIAAAIGALIVAIPSFKTRGDYLAIISLAFCSSLKAFLKTFRDWEAPGESPDSRAGRPFR